MHIVHMTSAHPRYDTRIFVKQCRSLSAHGHRVTLIVADGKGDEEKDGVHILDVGRVKGRIRRMLHSAWKVYAKARSLGADLYHLHDPELIPYALKLKSLDKPVIFDSHEDVPKQLLGKPYLGPFALRALSEVFALYEAYASRRIDGIVAATPFIRDKFQGYQCRTVDVNNFPIPDELGDALPTTHKRREVCYVGGLSAVRGIREMVRANESLQSGVRLNLVGAFADTGLKQEVSTYAGWAMVNELGYLDRVGVRDVLSRSIVGLVTLHAVPNHLDSQPNKMFEYMSAGIPVIASDFPLWRSILENNDCGICVDPRNPLAIAEAIDYLATYPDVAQRMGANGRAMVENRYNWAVEEKKLFRFYASLV
ncbi:glycosyltransferase [Noviherbaspirillum sp. Root189]|uniref:glycosyltransferase n=1 Tax=Noviherbaspirillum sp. Root189 TaxID=1736487 RepID=UPI00070ECC05|nr:glycosyltransferase [Noviherbaspirillum sp. Root189]KRB91445.1 glycosyl transferase [Noviherbaspirillum sp. Root189]